MEHWTDEIMVIWTDENWKFFERTIWTKWQFRNILVLKKISISQRVMFYIDGSQSVWRSNSSIWRSDLDVFWRRGLTFSDPELMFPLYSSTFWWEWWPWLPFQPIKDLVQGIKWSFWVSWVTLDHMNTKQIMSLSYVIFVGSLLYVSRLRPSQGLHFEGDRSPYSMGGS